MVSPKMKLCSLGVLIKAVKPHHIRLCLQGKCTEPSPWLLWSASYDRWVLMKDVGSVIFLGHNWSLARIQKISKTKIWVISMINYEISKWWFQINLSIITLYPLVNYNITMERFTMLFMGKSTISTGPFSIAMFVYQRVSHYFPIKNGGCSH